MVAEARPVIRELRLRQVLEFVTAAGEAGVSLKDVARALGVKPTVYVTQLLEQLETWGYVRRAWAVGRQVHYRWFVVTQEVLSEKDASG